MRSHHLPGSASGTLGCSAAHGGAQSISHCRARQPRRGARHARYRRRRRRLWWWWWWCRWWCHWWCRSHRQSRRRCGRRHRSVLRSQRCDWLFSAFGSRPRVGKVASELGDALGMAIVVPLCRCRSLDAHAQGPSLLSVAALGAREWVPRRHGRPKLGVGARLPFLRGHGAAPTAADCTARLHARGGPSKSMP